MLQTQLIELELDSITAADYMAHFVDADPPNEASRLRSVSLDADPLDDTVVATLRWDGTPPATRTAAALAGLHMTADVVALRSRVDLPGRLLERRTARRLRPLAQAA
jgi:hypothetical protein